MEWRKEMLVTSQKDVKLVIINVFILVVNFPHMISQATNGSDPKQKQKSMIKENKGVEG